MRSHADGHTVAGGGGRREREREERERGRERATSFTCDKSIALVTKFLTMCHDKAA